MYHYHLRNMLNLFKVHFFDSTLRKWPKKILVHQFTFRSIRKKLLIQNWLVYYTFIVKIINENDIKDWTMQYFKDAKKISFFRKLAPISSRIPFCLSKVAWKNVKLFLKKYLKRVFLWYKIATQKTKMANVANRTVPKAVICLSVITGTQKICSNLSFNYIVIKNINS